MADIEVGTETEATNHWAYDVSVFDGGRKYDYRVTLSFQDYDLWSRGRVSPSRVIESAFRYLLANEPASSIMTRFDCSVIRRYFPKVDEELPRML